MNLFRYSLKIICFLFPVGLFLALPWAVLWRSNEFQKEFRIVEAMNGSERVLVGNAFWPQSGMDVVLENIRLRHPVIIALGNSRVLQFRSEVFSHASFFNAGGTIGRIHDIGSFVDQIPAEQKPRVILLGLEQSFFHPIWETESAVPTDRVNGIAKPNIETYLSIWPNVYSSALKGKISFTKLLSRQTSLQTFGLNALMSGSGFRNDGSYQYGVSARDRVNPRSEDFQFKETMSRIERACCRFEQSADVSEKALADLDALLERSSAEGIRVVGFLPPYPHEVLEKMKSSGNSYAYISKLDDAIRPLFEKRGLPFFDFTDLRSTGASDGEYIDGLHASEKAYVRIWIQMAEKDPALDAYADIPQLKKSLEESKNDVDVFGEYEP